MPKLIYCTYLTVYTGNKLPSFYIGSTSIDNISKGYRGSVASKNYKSIWKQELSDHPDLFKTSILTRHETRQEAMEREIIFHEALSVARNPMYINMAHANGKFFNVGPKSPETIAKMTGKNRSSETKAKMSAAKIGKKQSPEQIAKRVSTQTGKKRGPQSPEHKAKLTDAKTGKKRSSETKAKMSVAQTGKKRGPQSPEHKAKIGAANTGKKRTSETKAKMSAAQTGKKRETLEDTINII